MATVFNQDQVQRPQGTGYEGQGPAVDLPTMGAEQSRAPLRVTVHVGDKSRPLAEQQERPATPAPEDRVNPDWSNIQRALEEGYSRDEISSYLQETQKLTPDDADKQVIDSVQAKIKAAQKEGYSDDEIKDFLITNKYDGSIIDSAMATARTPKPHRKYAFDPIGMDMINDDPADTIMDVADMYHNLHDKYSNLGKQVLGVFDEQAGLEARRDIDRINRTISAKLNEKGFQTQINQSTGELEYADKDGNMRPVDSSFMNGVFNSKGEIAGSISGAITGGRAGAAIGTAVLPGWGTFVGGALGTAGGGAVGAMAGRGADMVLNSYMLKEELDAKLVWTQMKEAGAADAVFNVAGAGVLKGGAAAGRGLMRAYDFVLAGNSKGAYKALLENMLIDEAQAKEIVQQWETLAGRSAPGKNFQERAISVLTTTQQGGDVFLQPSVGKDPKLANTIVAEVSARAKGLYRAIDQVDAEGAGKLLREDLEKYKADVQEFYGLVKAEGGEAVDGTDFRFDMDKLAVRPALEAVYETVDNPRQREKFGAYLLKLDSVTSGRTFSDLIELRQTINQFKYSTSKLSKRDKEVVNGALKRVDSLIEKTANEYMDHPKDWLKNWKLAKAEYSRMKVVEGNLLYKAITKKGATEDSIAKAISKNINALDGTFDQVLDKLPPATRAKTEAAIIKVMADKFSIGHVTDLQATHFPMLADSLKGMNIKTPEARRLVQTIDEMAKVFKNDINLGQLSGRLTVPQFQSYLTTDPVMRAKFEVASGMFQWLKRMAPTKTGNNLALVNKVSKLLENPMHARTAEDFIKGMPKESQAEMRSLVKELQLQWGKQPVKPKGDFVKMYKQSASGKLSATNGAWGKGVYLVQKVKNPLPGSKVVGHEVNMSRIATFKDLSNAAASEVTPKNIHRYPQAMQQLVDRGYLGLTDGDRVMLFPETTQGIKGAFKPVPEREWPGEVPMKAPKLSRADIVNIMEDMSSKDKAYMYRDVYGVEDDIDDLINLVEDMSTNDLVELYRASVKKEAVQGVKGTFKAVPEREGPSAGDSNLTSGSGAATKSYNKMNQVVKNLTRGFISEQEANKKALELGFTLYKHTDGSWKYNPVPERKWPTKKRFDSNSTLNENLNIKETSRLINDVFSRNDYGKATSVIADLIKVLPEDDFNKAFLNRYLVKHKNALTKVSVRIGDEADSFSENHFAFYSYYGNEIVISPDISAAQRVKSFTHEVIHAITTDVLSATNSKHYKQFDEIFKEYKKYNDDYATTDINEFVAEAFSNSETAMNLGAISYKGTTETLKDKFYQIIADILGIEIDDKSAYARMIAIMDSIE